MSVNLLNSFRNKKQLIDRENAQEQLRNIFYNFNWCTSFLDFDYLVVIFLIQFSIIPVQFLFGQVFRRIFYFITRSTWLMIDQSVECLPPQIGYQSGQGYSIVDSLSGSDIYWNRPTSRMSSIFNSLSLSHKHTRTCMHAQTLLSFTGTLETVYRLVDVYAESNNPTGKVKLIEVSCLYLTCLQ